MASARGLTGVTLGQLASQAEMSKSGLFAHFRSKDDLEIELLRMAEATLHREVVDEALKAPAGAPRLRALMDHWLGWAGRAGLPGGCPLYGAVFELDDAAPGPVRDHLVQSHASWTAFLTDVVKEAVEHGDLPRNLDVDQFVWRLIGIYLAHHVLERLLRDPAAHARGMAAFEDALVAAMTHSPATPAPHPNGSEL
jgi:AcrR family transcriptional regulator